MFGWSITIISCMSLSLSCVYCWFLSLEGLQLLVEAGVRQDARPPLRGTSFKTCLKVFKCCIQLMFFLFISRCIFFVVSCCFCYCWLLFTQTNICCYVLSRLSRATSSASWRVILKCLVGIFVILLLTIIINISNTIIIIIIIRARRVSRVCAFCERASWGRRRPWSRSAKPRTRSAAARGRPAGRPMV